MSKKSDLTKVSTSQLRMELMSREVSERKTQQIQEAAQSADESMAIVVDAYYETLEKCDPNLEDNRAEHDNAIVESLKTILDAYWHMNRQTWQEGRDAKKPTTFDDLAREAAKKPLDFSG